MVPVVVGLALLVLVVLRLRRWFVWLAVAAVVGIGVPGLLLSVLLGVVRLRGAR
jgi:hypothetical protein